MIEICKTLPDGTEISISGVTWADFCRNVSDAMEDDEADRVLDMFGTFATPEVPA